MGNEPEGSLPRLPFRHFHHQIIYNGDDGSRTRNRYSLTFISRGPFNRTKYDEKGALPIGRRRQNWNGQLLRRTQESKPGAFICEGDAL